MKSIRHVLFLFLALTSICYAQNQPNVAAQREAMKKLDFLVGKWSGDASVTRGPGEPLKLRQSEDVQYKLDGLVMLVEGTGRNAEGQVVFHALATISYDDATSIYHFRAYNDGRYLDTELTVQPKGFAWGFTSGPNEGKQAGGPVIKVTNTMLLDEKGNWLETTESTYGASPPRKSVEMNLHRQP